MPRTPEQQKQFEAEVEAGRAAVAKAEAKAARAHNKQQRERLRFHFRGPLLRPGERFVRFVEVSLQKFRRYVRLSAWKIPAIDPGDPDAVDDHGRVRYVLAYFDKVSDEVREQLVVDLVPASRSACGGVDVRKRHKSNKAMGKHVFMSDVGSAMKRAGLPVTDWQKHEEGGGESLYYQVAHALGDVFGLQLPQDLGPPAEQAKAAKITEEMSPAMRVWQDAELVRQRRQRLRVVWGNHLVEPPQTCEELAAAYLGFPFGTPDSPNRVARPGSAP